ncbi:Uncharacterised protein [uncultured archaeon]|nr:Uncharacterised protein [uncultured archaeon]
MELEAILPTVIEFIKLLVLVFAVSFVIYKIFSPARQWLAKRLNLSWIKSSLLLNFAAMLVLIFAIYIAFMWLGSISAIPRDPDLDYNIFENFTLLFAASGRLVVAAILTSFILLFFEMIASFFMGSNDSRKGKKERNELVSQAIGILIMSAVFILLLLFVFDWVPLGLFIYIFYGSINPLPMAVLAGI